MTTRAWDWGIRWKSVRTVKPTELPFDVAYLRAHVLRTANGNYEDPHLDRLIASAADLCERETHEAIMPQTWELRMTGFPSHEIVLPLLPLISVSSFAYVDEDGVTQTLSVGSPAEVEVSPSGRFTRAAVRPLYDATWPTTRVQADAVVITYRAGYEDAEDIPESYITGMCLYAGELYKQRSLSVQSTIQNIPAVLQLERFWRPRF